MVVSKSPADAVHEALQLDQVAFPKHLQELATMLKEIETKLKPTIAKYVLLQRGGGFLFSQLKVGLCYVYMSIFTCGVGVKENFIIDLFFSSFFCISFKKNI